MVCTQRTGSKLKAVARLHGFDGFHGCVKVCSINSVILSEITLPHSETYIFIQPNYSTENGGCRVAPWAWWTCSGGGEHDRWSHIFTTAIRTECESIFCVFLCGGYKQFFSREILRKSGINNTKYNYKNKHNYVESKVKFVNTVCVELQKQLKLEDNWVLCENGTVGPNFTFQGLRRLSRPWLLLVQRVTQNMCC